MKLLFFISCTIFFLFAASVFAQTPQEHPKGSIVFFASERIQGDLIKPYFDSIAGGQINFNECEGSLGNALAEKGYSINNQPITESQQIAARRLAVVFGRYTDVSAMPNNTVAQAAAIVDKTASIVVACKATADEPRWKRRKTMSSSCANAYCKAVDTASKRRITTASGLKCLQQDPNSGGKLAAIREVCKEIGTQLGDNLAKN